MAIQYGHNVFMFDLKLNNLSKKFDELLAVNDVSFNINSGEFFSVLGPSGCGKSTTLRMIAGFVMPSGGKILIGDNDITYQAPETRNIGFVFQNYAIFPHMNVFDNIAFGLKMRNINKNEIIDKVKKSLEQVNLLGFENRYQRELSGGEQQRVALARVLVTEPQILLLDEPLSALDKKLREEMKIWIKELQRKLKITTVYVTHDQSEALTMSDRIAIMDKGKISQIGTPTEIYEKPANKFVADFIGISNFLPLEKKSYSGDYINVSFLNQNFQLKINEKINQEFSSAVLRPEHIIFNPNTDKDICILEGTIDIISYQGAIIRYIINSNEFKFISEFSNLPESKIFKEGETVKFGFDINNLVLV
ncbi:MAG: Sulfate/thiosulfate import ATP-binding protein CysA [Alphaproteobacteria bacterium MarineAlpha5_Bin9]|nr:MAG: Sulfate/thiosulfate import ATP-binding protein CysA [Alphaproteobacteria bacterium MarineAlpha5_Bin9]